MSEIIDQREMTIQIKRFDSDGCGICGGALVEIRGRFPKDPKRTVCPTCNTERLEQIHEISSPSYGQASRVSGILPAQEAR